MTNVREEVGPVPRSSNWTGAGLIFTSFTDILLLLILIYRYDVLDCFLLS